MYFIMKMQNLLFISFILLANYLICPNKLKKWGIPGKHCTVDSECPHGQMCSESVCITWSLRLVDNGRACETSTDCYSNCCWVDVPPRDRPWVQQRVICIPAGQPG